MIRQIPSAELVCHIFLLSVDVLLSRIILDLHTHILPLLLGGKSDVTILPVRVFVVPGKGFCF